MVTIGPGMVDTYLQQVARSKTREEYASSDFLRQAFGQGMLEKTEIITEKIYIILENKFDQSRYVKANEV